MTTTIPSAEKDFEGLIVAELTGAGGWVAGDPKGYDAELGLYAEDVVDFLSETQPKTWERLHKLTGGETAARSAVLKRLAAQLDRAGTVDVLRKGFSERGVSFSLCQLRPAHSIDPDTEARYAANLLRVVRQVRFDPKSGESVDLVLFVNGVPTATAELKNRWTGQQVEHAIKQYREDRDPRNTLFARRAFVHFAMDAELAFMTTRLEGKRTAFLPFNQGSGGAGEPGGKGNPGVADGHPTSYVWREVWDRDRWLELIQKFVHVEPADPAKKGSRPTVIFPRYHQWHVVVSCQAHARVHGAGQNYLIQHSAGSGKTKEIAWLAHDLSTLHQDDDSKVFDKVIVITDRRVLDRQLREQIAQFEQVAGVVRSVTQGSSELKDALGSEQAKIITTTLQKFPFVLKALDDEALKHKRYAVIVDEAHSSQTGESATDLKEALGALRPEDLDLDEDDGTPPALLARLAARGKQPNLSFFAFTATPKGKTLELFGTRDAAGQLRAFHTYSMRQAIEEGFILDVLANYTTYEQLRRLEDKAGKELEVPAGQASSRLARFAELHPYVKSQKAAVVVDHFKRVVRPLLGGEAKAMVVCESREEAVQWKRALDQEIERHGHDDVKTLVAFSGEVTVRNVEADNAGMSYTEPEMNKQGGKPLPEAKLPEEFDKPAYGVLVVAEKYQTGFDQPKLCGMYVDKKLTGVNAVQTLSRLNRSHRGKDSVYVLDFRNTGEEIRKAFEPFFGRTEGVPSDPNVLFDAADTVTNFGVINDAELDAFAAAWARLEEIDEDKRHAVLSTSTQAAYDAARDLDSDTRFALREALNRFVRFYGFLSQALPYIPPRTEVLFQFSKVLMKRLASDTPDGGLDLAGDVVLTHYRLQEVGTEKIALGDEDVEPLKAITGDGTGAGGRGEIPMGLLGELVELFNERYGADLGDTDMLKVATDVRDTIRDKEPGLAEQAANNSREDFVRDRDGMLIDAAMTVDGDRDRQAALLKAFLDDEDFRARAGQLIFGAIFDSYQGGQQAEA
ncbi:type I restriction endonuclease subunit R [Paraconexibacter algicola]|uniref:Restriction endonuclease subunit R n=1 Tax=Paraconexibacter algicola TaxID=2133960 RepID=A0A2T4UEB9_9ACTN|nr:type I restriction endonuclease [Paraconexibacter algicola]PTL56137.1 restriction endonuclease subunit R [Paraconexibacter algicola]